MELISQVLALQPTTQGPTSEPFVTSAVILMVILVVPILFERLKLPALVGLVLSGVVLGPAGWNLFQRESSMIDFVSDIGLVYLMFVTGLEVDIKQLCRRQNRALGFGCLTFCIPLLVGIAIGRTCDFNWISSILIGALFASHTLLAYPIVNRLGLANNESISVTSVATIFTDIASLLILGVCIAVNSGNYNYWQLISLLVSLIIYSIAVLVGVNVVGLEFFRRSGNDQGHQFLFILLVVFLSVGSAQLIGGNNLIGVEKIYGAFLAGLAVNEAVGDGPVKEKAVFVGSVLFIPIFFVYLGINLDLSALFKQSSAFKLTILILIGLFTSKFLAAFCAKFLYRYSWQEMLTMWSLSLPQVGSTITAALVGYRGGLLTEQVFSSVIILMLVTSIAGPYITSRVAVGLSSLTQPEIPDAKLDGDRPKPENNPFTIVVPVYNPQTQHYLIEMAALLARQTKGRIVPLAIATAWAQMDTPQLSAALARSSRLLNKAKVLSSMLGVEAEPLLRIDDSYAPGITRASREQNASLILMGWGNRTGFRARLFGNTIDNVLWGSHCPVAVTRLVESPKKIERILVSVENLTSPSLYPIQFAQILAEANQAQVTVLKVCERRTSSSKIQNMRSQIASLLSKLNLQNPPDIQIIAHENAAQAILQAARLYDLVVLPFTPNRSSPGGLAIGDVNNQLARQLTCSIVMLAEPQRSQTSMLALNVINTTTTVV